MKYRYLALLPLLVLCSCTTNKPVNSSSQQSETPVVEEEKYYALFMYNYPRMDVDTPSGNPGKTDNLLYTKKEIELNKTFTAPEKDPERENYTFSGWFKEEACENAWNFETDKPVSSTFLYAKWEVYMDDSYVEPEYIVPEKIITDNTFVVEGILNVPIEAGKVKLSTGAIKRLEAHPEDVKFAINYARRQDVTLKSATYDDNLGVITVTDSLDEVFEVSVLDNSEAYVLDNSTYETKASNYEKNGAEFENYHIMLAGSSSMEFWTKSTQDMKPIVSYNTGIGGTTVEQWTEKLIYRLVLPYSPKAVVYYVGVNNIINGGNTGEETADKIETLLNKTHELLPNAQVFYVLINKLPGYLSYQSDFDKANARPLSMAQNNEWLTCIDAGKDLLKANGQPNQAYFLMDGLHMSLAGYAIWGKVIKNQLIADLKNA